MSENIRGKIRNTETTIEALLERLQSELSDEITARTLFQRISREIVYLDSLEKALFMGTNTTHLRNKSVRYQRKLTIISLIAMVKKTSFV